MLVYLSLGSNLGDRAAMLRRAIAGLREQELEPRAVSPVYETEPQGRRDQPWFLNCVVAVETTLPALAILERTQRVEAALGRLRLAHWGPRVIDIDILLAGDIVVKGPALTVPHPRLTERAFALVPLADLDPDLVIPGGGLVRELAERRRYEQGQTVRLWGHLPEGQPTKVSSEPQTRGDMRLRLLELLRQHPDGISGSAAATRLGVTRAAVWKHVQRLRQLGYAIEGTRGSGYRLHSVEDSLSADGLVDGRNRIVGRVLHVLRSVESTNTLASQLARQGSAEGTVILAEEQTRGRGRNGRTFLSPPGGVYLSVILRPNIPPAAAARLTLAAAVAVAEAVETLTQRPTTIKWPNDVLLPEGKVAGILLELSGQEDRVDFVVIGVGMNVLSAPPGVGAAAMATAARSVTRPEAARTVLRHLDALYAQFQQGGWSDILERWRRRSATLGQRVRVSTARGVFTGFAEEVTEDGALLLRDGQAVRVILAGDVENLREAADEPT